MPARDEIPSTLKRSPKHAQEIFEKTLDSARETYDGDGERARRTAFAAVKHEYEKVGDHWEEKESSGPSDRKAAGGVDSPGRTEEGVDARATKEHLMQVARRLDVRGRSTMTKDELIEAIKKANRRETARARRS